MKAVLVAGIDEDIIEMCQIAATFNVQNSDDLLAPTLLKKVNHMNGTEILYW
jgi:hypothetical protein